MRFYQKSIPLGFFFCLALFALFFATAFLPNIRFLYFSPFFAILIQRKSILPALWISTLCGLLLDIINTETPFGVFSLCSLLTIWVCYRLKHYFFEENFFSIPLFTSCISLVFSAIQLFILDPISSYSILSMIPIFLIMPLFDALYAFLWFTCPSVFYNFIRRLIRG